METIETTPGEGAAGEAEEVGGGWMMLTTDCVSQRSRNCNRWVLAWCRPSCVGGDGQELGDSPSLLGGGWSQANNQHSSYF